MDEALMPTDRDIVILGRPGRVRRDDRIELAHWRERRSTI